MNAVDELPITCAFKVLSGDIDDIEFQSVPIPQDSNPHALVAHNLRVSVALSNPQNGKVVNFKRAYNTQTPHLVTSSSEESGATILRDNRGIHVFKKVKGGASTVDMNFGMTFSEMAHAFKKLGDNKYKWEVGKKFLLSHGILEFMCFQATQDDGLQRVCLIGYNVTNCRSLPNKNTIESIAASRRSLESETNRAYHHMAVVSEVLSLYRHDWDKEYLYARAWAKTQTTKHYLVFGNSRNPAGQGLIERREFSPDPVNNMLVIKSYFTKTEHPCVQNWRTNIVKDDKKLERSLDLMAALKSVEEWSAKRSTCGKEPKERWIQEFQRSVQHLRNEFTYAQEFRWTVSMISMKERERYWIAKLHFDKAQNPSKLLFKLVFRWNAGPEFVGGVVWDDVEMTQHVAFEALHLEASMLITLVEKGVDPYLVKWTPDRSQERDDFQDVENILQWTKARGTEDIKGDEVAVEREETPQEESK